MNRFLKLFILVLVFTFLNASDVYADWTNDGKAKANANECYGDSGYTSSYKDVKYYDVALPYKETCKSIGGYATAGNLTMSSSTQNANIGSLIAREASYSFFQSKCPTLWKATGAKASKYDYDNHIAVMTDSNGIQYYVMAIQGYFYNYTGAKKGFSSFNTCAGQLCDVILTDGTCIHFVIGDANANTHTNGGSKDGKKDYFTGFSPLNYEHYRNLFAASNGNCPEIWGDANSAVTEFRKRFGLSSDVRIAYYRLYNKKFGDKIEVVSEDAKKSSYKLGASSGGKVASGVGGQAGSSTSSENKENVAVNASFLDGGYTSEELSAFNALCEININEVLINNASLHALDQSDVSSIGNWKRNVEYSPNRWTLPKLFRIPIMVVGMALVIWSVLIYLAFWIDRTNNLFDFDLVGLLTAGSLHTAMEDKDATYSMTSDSGGKTLVNHRHIISISLTGIVMGGGIVTGWLFRIISAIINWCLLFFGSFL